MTLRVGIIGDTGRGGYGHSLDLAFRDVPNARVVAVADPDEEGGRRAAERTGAAAVYRDYRRMLEKERPDIVAICPRWCDQRAEMVVAAVEAGVKGVFCEKPMAPTLADADRIVASCERRGVRMAVAHRRASGYEIHAKRLIDEGLIGEVRFIRALGKGDHRAGAEDLAVLGPHLMDSMRYFAGSDVRWVHGHVTRDGRDVTPADVHEGAEGIGLIAGNGVFAHFAFANGVTATYESFASDRPGAQRFGLEIVGTKGILTVRDSPRGELYHYPHGTFLPSDGEGLWRRILLDEWERHPDGTPRSGRDWMHASNRLIVTELLRAIEEEREVTGVANARDARAALEMIHAVHVSQRTGARVYLPLAERGNPYEDWRA